jgi:phosphate:Na+ symporter
VSWAVERTVRSLGDNDPAVAKEVAEFKAEINSLVASAERHLSRRLAASEPMRLTAFRLESEILEHLKRIYYFARRIASMVVENVDGITDDTAAKDEEKNEEPSAADSSAAPAV